MDPQAPASSPVAAAQCPLHFGQPFNAVCKRCGAYVCRSCTEDGRFDLCPSCRARAGVGDFPLRRDQLSLGALLDFSFQRYKQHWLVLALALLITGVAVGALNAAGTITQLLLPDQLVVVMIVQAALLIPQILVQSLLTLGLVAISIRAVRGEPIELGMLFGEWKRLGGFFLQSLLANLVFIPIVLLLAIPFIVGFALSAPAVGIGIGALTFPIAFVGGGYMMLGLFFATPELLARPSVSAIDALRSSWELARGHRLDIVLASLVMLALMTVGLVACLIGALFTGGFALLIYAALYLGLRNGAEDLAD